MNTNEHNMKASRFDGRLRLFIQASPYDTPCYSPQSAYSNWTSQAQGVFVDERSKCKALVHSLSTKTLGLAFSILQCQSCNAETLKGAIFLAQSTWESAGVNWNPGRRLKTQTVHAMRHLVDPRKTGHEWQKQWLETVWWNRCPISPIIPRVPAHISKTDWGCFCDVQIQVSPNQVVSDQSASYTVARWAAKLRRSIMSISNWPTFQSQLWSVVCIASWVEIAVAW